MRISLSLALLLACACARAAPAPVPAPVPECSTSAESAISTSTPPAPPTPPSTPPKALDPAADRAARIAFARDELGPSAAMTTEDPFILAGPGWTRGSLALVANLVRDALAALFNERFTTRPARSVGVYLFADATSYERFCKSKLGEACISPFGFYRPDARVIVMNAAPGIGTLTHEMVHPLVETDFPGAPTWIDEGIASLFEAPVIPRRGEIHGAKNWRLPRLRRAIGSARERDAARLDALFGMSDERFRDDAEDLHYAMARYACQWLDERGALWSFYRAWRDGVADDPTGAKAFERAMGKVPSAMNDEWVAWVRRI